MMQPLDQKSEMFGLIRQPQTALSHSITLTVNDGLIICGNVSLGKLGFLRLLDPNAETLEG